ncbi:MAG: hypothetical protein CMJ49_01470, partial [Planctomycetaceae bacterium]|nr:hypothetical protein [Planctomycetaceae bacterium]
IWPAEAWAKGKAETVREYRMTLAECNGRWVRSVGMAFEDFVRVIGGARVGSGTLRTDDDEHD